MKKKPASEIYIKNYNINESQNIYQQGTGNLAKQIDQDRHDKRQIIANMPLVLKVGGTLTLALIIIGIVGSSLEKLQYAGNQIQDANNNLQTVRDEINKPQFFFSEILTSNFKQGFLHFSGNGLKGSYYFETTFEPGVKVSSLPEGVGINDRTVSSTLEITKERGVTGTKQISFLQNDIPILFEIKVEKTGQEITNGKEYVTGMIKFIFADSVYEIAPHFYVPKESVWDCKFNGNFEKTVKENYFVYDSKIDFNSSKLEINFKCQTKNRNPIILANKWWIQVYSHKLFGIETYNANYSGDYNKGFGITTYTEINYFPNTEYRIEIE